MDDGDERHADARRSSFDIACEVCGADKLIFVLFYVALSALGTKTSQTMTIKQNLKFSGQN